MDSSTALLQYNGKEEKLSTNDVLVIAQALHQHRAEINGHIQHMGYVELSKENFETLMQYYQKRKELCNGIINKLSRLTAAAT